LLLQLLSTITTISASREEAHMGISARTRSLSVLSALVLLYLGAIPTDVRAQQSCAATVSPDSGWTTESASGVSSYGFNDDSPSWQDIASTVERRTINLMLATGWQSFSMNRQVESTCFIDDGVCINYPWSGVDQWGEPQQNDGGWESTHLVLRPAYSCRSGYALGYSPVGDPICEVANVNLRQCVEAKPDPNRGCSADAMEGNPCNLATGNKYQSELDYRAAAGSALEYKRYYNSDVTTPLGSHGKQWRGSFDRYLVFSFDASVTAAHSGPHEAYVQREDGRIIHYYLSDPITPKSAGTVETLREVNSTTWEFVDADGNVETYKLAIGNGIYSDFARLESIRYASGQTLTLQYNSSGLLSVVKDLFGHKLTFTYNAATRISKFTDPAGKAYTFTYNSAGYLTKVTYPDTKFRQYTYATGGNAGALASIIDENGSTYASWTYDTSRRAASSQHAGGAEAVTFTYNANGTATATDSFGSARTYAFELIDGALKPIARNTGSLSESISYDANGLVSSRIDKRAVETTYTYDSRGLETSRTEAVGTPSERSIATQWHATLRKPTLVTESGRSTAYTYDANGNVLTRIVTDTATSQSRTWTYTYDTYNRVLTENGPRSDVSDLTTYTYYTCTTGTQCGRVQTIKNALNQITTFNTYNAHGQPLTITDPNGVATALAYDLRSRITSISRAGELTSFAYHPTGLLQRVTLPDTSYLQYSYDNAHRLTEVADGLGNRVVYSLDSMGNWTAENVYDPSSALARARSRVYNNLNQLWKELTAAGSSAQTTVFGYDNESNITSINEPLGRNTVNEYDALGRLMQITDPMLGTTTLAYDDGDRLVTAIDPKSLTTSYTYSGFGDLIEQTSPDTGTTAMTYDAAGNLATHLDARGELATYSYDSLNRVTQIAYGDQTLAFTYDVGANGKGRLTQVSDNSGTTTWSYTAAGRVSTKTQAVAAVSKSVTYGYNTAGALTTITLPSGQVVTYTYANGRVTNVKVGATTIVDSVLYEPFGPIRQWSWGNGTLAVRTRDQDGSVTQIDSAGLRTYSHDDALRITGITDMTDSSLSQSYGYDASNRLTTATGALLNQGWIYDQNGSRTAQTGSTPSTHVVSSASNRLTSINGGLTRSYTYDSSGNVMSDGTATFTYNDAGRMSSVTKAAVMTTYAFNALGQRVKKSTGGSSTYFAYDEAGRLIGEYDSSGALIQETVWLENIPVATLRPNGGNVSVFYVHTDHLNTPRRISRPSDNSVIWRWDSDPFGSSAANQDPDGDSAQFVYNLRFAGQYFDVETGLHHNYFRDYDPATGRYVQSDPIGLAAGINTFGYVEGNPIRYADPFGLDAEDADGTPGFAFPPLFPAFTPGTQEYNDLVDSGTEFLNDLERLLTGPLLNERERGLPPEGIKPPVSGECKEGPASRPSEKAKGGKSLWDPNGGEWRWYPGDRWHNPHWDYNPHDRPASPWVNVPHGDLPPVRPEPDPK
jgi:RHS repeat-associated protein